MLRDACVLAEPIAFGPRAGQNVLTLQGAMPRETDFKEALALTVKGSAARRRALRGRRPPSAGATVPPHHPPALDNEPVQTNAAGQVVLKLKSPWRDGSTHL
jgi:hypothetical protein